MNTLCLSGQNRQRSFPPDVTPIVYMRHITKFIGTAGLAEVTGENSRAIERAIKAGDITPDALHETPKGRTLALFAVDRIETMKLLFTNPESIL